MVLLFYLIGTVITVIVIVVQKNNPRINIAPIYYPAPSNLQYMLSPIDRLFLQIGYREQYVNGQRIFMDNFGKYYAVRLNSWGHIEIGRANNYQYALNHQYTVILQYQYPMSRIMSSTIQNDLRWYFSQPN